MGDYDTIINELINAIVETRKKVGSWQKEILLLLLEAVLGIYENLRLEEIDRYNNNKD